MNARFSQPHDDSASSAIVTTTTALNDNLQFISNSQQQQAQLSPMPEAPSSTVQQDGLASTSQDFPPRNEPSENWSTQHNNNNNNNNNKNNDEEGRCDEENGLKEMSHEDLGIITAKPSKPEYAVLSSRLASLKDWPANHHILPQDLADAGFYYTGVEDCARCFCCGGGLRRWDLEDDVWVEHAVWFPRCAFLQQKAGKPFIDRVHEIRNDNDTVKFDETLQRLLRSNVPASTKLLERSIQKDAAVLAVKDHGLDTNEVIELALEIICKDGLSLSSDKLFQASRAKDVSSDTLFQASRAKDVSSDTLFQASRAKDVSSDTLFQASRAKDVSSDTLFQASKAKDVSSDKLFQASRAKDVSSDTLFQASRAKDVSSDTLFQASKAKDVSSDTLFQASKAKDVSETNDESMEIDPATNTPGRNEEDDKEIIQTLRKDNQDLRQHSICKICLEEQIADVFLPCGHFLSCTDCSFALTTCPLCRSEIKGRVKGYIG